MRTTNRQSRAIVVGAGIAGLSATIALRRAGWDVAVLERSRFKSEIGAAISSPPNSTRVLDRWGFDSVKAQGVPNIATVGYDAATLEQFMYDEFTDIGEVMGGASWSFHRVDLHRGLQDLARAVPRPGEGEVDIQLGVEAKSVDCEEGIVTLIDGEKVQADLVIIADGAHSRLIESFTSSPTEVVPTGRSIYRWLVSTSDVLADPALRAIYDPATTLPGFRRFRDADKDILWVTYTCRGGRALNNAVVHPTQPGEGDDSLWHSTVAPAAVLAMLDNFHDVPRRIVGLASEDGIKVHRLFKRPALGSFVRGRAVVVGDAAHIMLPTHAAGGALAIESAAALEVLLRGVDGRDKETMGARLAMFDRLRVPRCNLTMLASNAGPPWLAVPGVEEEVRKYYDGPLPPAGALPWMAEFREALFHYDVYGAAEEMLARG
ncbi:3-hydroxybenzoate 6-hydroxylase [Podospora conica]|nr:3-hydroxybenzoate 6-hydroxylase [Schizothecium conicum]